MYAKNWWICHHSVVQETHKPFEIFPAERRMCSRNLSFEKKMRWRIEFILGKLHEFLNSIIHNLTVFHFIVLFLGWWYQYNSEKINGKKRQFLFCYVCCLRCTLDKKHGLSKIRWGFWCFVPWDFFASCSPVKIVFREFAVVADAALQTRVLG